MNNALKTHCKHGHEYTPENTINKIKIKNGKPYAIRECRICQLDNVRRAKAKKKDDPRYIATKAECQARYQRKHKDKINAYHREYYAKMRNAAQQPEQ